MPTVIAATGLLLQAWTQPPIPNLKCKSPSISCAVSSGVENLPCGCLYLSLLWLPTSLTIHALQCSLNKQETFPASPAGSNPCCVAGIDTATGSKIEITKPDNFDAAIEKLGLDHALGSLRLMRFKPPATDENTNVANLPAGGSSQQAGNAEQTSNAKDGVSSPWLMLQVQLGLPLAPAELCDLVCR